MNSDNKNMTGIKDDPSLKAKELHLPVSRVKTIMKSSPDVETVGQEPLFLVTKVTELFIADLAKEALAKSKEKSLEYKHIADIVQNDDTLDFLREIMPPKITVRQYKHLMQQKANRGDDSDTTTSDEDETDEDESEVDENEPDNVNGK